MLDRFAAFLDQHQRILLTTHENPDGDGTGALVGLGHYLRLLGKDVRIVVTPSIAPFLAFLDEEGQMEAYDAEGAHRELAAWPDAWILVDASEPHRLGKMLPAFQASKAVKACLDHHMKDAPRGFDAEFTDATASASAQLVADMAYGRLPRPLPLTMAKALYAGLVDDTGNFRFSNATAAAHRLAADLIEDGAEPARTYQQLYHQGRRQKLLAQGRAFESLAWHAEGRYARMSLGQADMVACEAVHSDLEGLVNKPLEVGGTEVSALLEEQPDGRIKISLRSRERVNVQAVASLFGGGGHFLAAGAKLEGPMARAQQQLDQAVLSRLSLDLSDH